MPFLPVFFQRKEMAGKKMADEQFFLCFVAYRKLRGRLGVPTKSQQPFSECSNSFSFLRYNF